MADILQITEDIPVDDSIYEYEYKEYNPIVGTNLNRGSIVITNRKIYIPIQQKAF